VEYVATFEVFPDVEVLEMKGFAVEKPVADVKNEDVDNIIEVFCKQQGNWEPVERAAVDSDKVNIDYAGTRDGEEFEGGTAQDSELELGSGRMIPGFEDGVAGMKAGDEKTLALSFPDEYHNEELKGAAVEFKITLNSVLELNPAPVDEALFAQYGVADGGEEQFRKEVADNMARELKNAVEAKVKQQVMDAVLEAHQSLEVPQSLVDQEVGVMRQQMFQQFGGAGNQDLDLESLLPDTMFTENAERRVKLGLVMAEIIAANEIRADGEKVRGTIEEMASTYENPQEVIDHYYSSQEQLSAVESKVLEDQVVEKLLESANITENKCSYQDAISQDQQA
jgi:trigger factor